MTRGALRPLRTLADRYGDLALALGLSAFALVDIYANGYIIGSKPLLTALSLLMTMSLAWRRRAPFAVAATMAAALLLQVALEPTPHPPDVPFLAWLIAAYSVAAHADLRRALAGGALLVVAVDLWASFSPDDGGTDLVFLSVILSGFWIAGRVVRSRNVLAGKLAERTRELEREREENARLAVAEERTRIARELHDVVAHGVSVIVVNAGAERLVLGPGQESTRNVLRAIEEAGREALGEMGRLVSVLRTEADGTPVLDPQPGLDRIDGLVEGVREAGLAVELVIEGDRRAVAPGLDVSAYRIVQEALTNVIRHARGTKARVRVTYGAHDVGIEVADDGVGPRANGTRPGHGLVGMRERASLYGGDLQIGRSELGGYLVSARLPLPP